MNDSRLPWTNSRGPVTGPPIDRDSYTPKEIARLRGYILAQPSSALLEGGAFVRAACGKRVRVIYTRAFGATNEVEVCPLCAEMADLWRTDVAEYDRRVKERNERWAERNERQRERELEEWEAEQYFESQDDQDL